MGIAVDARFRKMETLRNCIFLLGFVSYELLYEFEDFAEKVCLRFGCARGEGKCRRNGTTQHRDFYKEGNFADGLKSVGSGKAMTKYFLTKRFEEARRQLDFPIYPSKKLSRVEKKSPTIYFVTNSFPHTTSGYAVRTEKVAHALRQKGIPVRVCTRAGYPLVVGRWEATSLISQRRQGLVRLIPWTFSWNAWQRRRKAVKLLEEEARDFNAKLIITTTGFENASIASEAARNLNIPWVYEVRGEPESTWLAACPQKRDKTSEFYRRSRRKENEAVTESGAQVFLSNVSKQSFAERGLSLSRPVILPNSLDESVLAANKACTSNKVSGREEAGEIVVGSVSSLVGYEGFDTLIDALASTSTRFRLLLVGGGKERNSLEQRAARLGLQDRVSFVGPQPHAEIGEWYKKLDIFVLPRRDQSVTRMVTPIKHLEAMARGIPVIASDLPALREATGGLATYFPAGDASELSQCLEGVARGNHQAEQAYRWVSERTWSNLIEDLIDELWSE
ncbi:glycosyltransferase family 4 protein [Corynebacterium sp. UMB6689]|uniref:glycosyltransferase family 4 protein n=1 Tax=Corynebacterium sp. UMB6689 TaxID=3046341 RepID=UPI0027B8F03E|nr:glycosyltransferase family 4 protein [Corynebacterium sp. UMB6689]